MRRGSGSQEAQRPGEFGDGKRIPNPGGGLLNKRRERQSCAINFVCALPLSLHLSFSLLSRFVFTIRPLEVQKTGPRIA